MKMVQSQSPSLLTESEAKVKNEAEDEVVKGEDGRRKNGFELNRETNAEA